MKTKSGTIQPGKTETTSNPVSGGSGGGSSSTVTATYELTVQADVGGTITGIASGKYKAGESISIASTADTGYGFTQWIASDDVEFANAFDSDTVFSMPENDVIITATFYGIVDYSADSDADGLSDYVEELLGTNPELIDTDSDGLPDGFEYNFSLTDPLIADTDDNGISDA